VDTYRRTGSNAFLRSRRPKPIFIIADLPNQDAALPRKRLQMILGYLSAKYYDLGSDNGSRFRSEPGSGLLVGLSKIFISPRHEIAFQSAQEPSCWSANLNCYMASVPRSTWEITLADYHPTPERSFHPRGSRCPAKPRTHFHAISSLSFCQQARTRHRLICKWNPPGNRRESRRKQNACPGYRRAGARAILRVDKFSFSLGGFFLLGFFLFSLS